MYESLKTIISISSHLTANFFFFIPLQLFKFLLSILLYFHCSFITTTFFTILLNVKEYLECHISQALGLGFWFLNGVWVCDYSIGCYMFYGFFKFFLFLFIFPFCPSFLPSILSFVLFFN